MNKYSVVIPMYNSEKTIMKTINSIYDQTQLDLIDEIIIIDDGSIDNSFFIVEKFIKQKKDNLIRLIKKQNGGAATARNLGIKLAKNKWIALLDSDDIWKKNKMEIQNEIIISNPFIHAIGSNRDGEIIEHGKKCKDRIYQISPFQYCLKNWPCTPSLIFDKTIFSNNNYFDESLTHAEEGIFFLDIAASSGLFYCLDSLVLCGDGKPAFGYSGLSGNIKKMHLGVLTMLSKAKKKGYISIVSYIFLKQYERLKYIRRKLIVMINNKKR